MARERIPLLLGTLKRYFVLTKLGLIWGVQLRNIIFVFVKLPKLNYAKNHL